MTAQKVTRHHGVRLAGTGIAVPQRVLTNDDLATIVETSDEWITQRTGIKTRRIVEEGVGIRQLAARAAAAAVANAGIEPAELDMLLLATMTPDMVCPCTAVQVIDDIGARPAGGFDLSAACSGFVYALNLAAGLIESGSYRHIAVVGAETLSKMVDYTDRRTCVLFGDGAGAAVLSACDDPNRGCLHQAMHSDGSLWEHLYVPRGEHHLPAALGEFNGHFDTLQMNGREVFKFAVKTTEKLIDDALEAAGIKPNDLAMIIPHQSNQRILASARDRLGLPEDKLYINIDRYGNTSAASVPLCLHELTDAGRIKTGDLVLFLAIGGGMTWASSLWRL
jgi:3-oxoacyl-[acyl-carrier-protein] synthase-3